MSWMTRLESYRVRWVEMGDKLWDQTGNDRAAGAFVPWALQSVAAPGDSWRTLAVPDAPRQTLNQ